MCGDCLPCTGMRKTRITFAALVVLAHLILSGCERRGGSEDVYPSRPITMLVPWNPGGGTDTVSRALASVLQHHIGQPVNVVNRTGGGGVVGHLALAQADPDGYTIGAVTVEISMMHWMGLTHLTPEDYTPISLLMDNPAAVTVDVDAPWRTLGELLDDIRARPGELLASGTSRGGIWDLARIGMLEAASLDQTALPWVPSQGAAPALQELLAGGVHVVTAALAETDALRKAGQVKVLAVMAEERLPAFPDVPTLKEQGIDWSLSSWVSVGAPAGLPDTVRQALVNAVAETAEDSAYTGPLEDAGFYLRQMSGPELSAFMAKQDSLNGELLALAGMAR